MTKREILLSALKTIQKHCIEQSGCDECELRNPFNNALCVLENCPTTWVFGDETYIPPIVIEVDE